MLAHRDIRATHPRIRHRRTRSLSSTSNTRRTYRRRLRAQKNHAIRETPIGLLTGQYYDEETGLHYNLNRYYDPSTGRYVTADPLERLGIKPSLNPYSYVDNQPINWFDVYGLFKDCSYWGGTNCRDVTPAEDGNFWPGFTEQDFGCSSVGALLENNSCVTQCCADHDNCYDVFACNQSSWLTTIFGADGPCNKCNRGTASCILNARKDKDCDECK